MLNPGKNLNNNITSKAKKLLLAHNFVVAGRIFFVTFLNLFIWKFTKDLTIIAWFNIIYLTLHTLTFSLAAFFIKKGKIHAVRIISLLGLAILYFIIFLLSENALNFLYPIAFSMGLFNGMYWIHYQVFRFDLTHQSSRGNYTGLEKGTKMFVDIVIPVLAGAIITLNFFNLQYANLFLLGGLFFLCAALLGNGKFPQNKLSPFELKKTFYKMWNNRDIRKTLFSYTLGQLGRDGVIVGLLLPLILFDVVNNELELGGLLSVFAVVGIIGSIAFGKLISYAHYQKSVVLGGLGFAILVALILIFPTYWLYILFGALANIVGIFIQIPKRVMNENLIQSLGDVDEHRIEYFVVREWFAIGFGKIVSFALLFALIGIQARELQWLLGVVIITVLLEAFLLRSIVPSK